MDGVINGTESEGSAVFSAGDAVTVQEAAVMLNNVLGATDVPTAAFDSAVPAWASQATANLTACGVLAVSGGNPSDNHCKSVFQCRSSFCGLES